jgi:DNA-binding NtrC family response regulator
VRQLQNEVQRAVLMAEGTEVQVGDLSLRSSKTDEGFDTSFTLMEGMERNAIVQMLRETGGNKLETARRLGIGRQTLYNKIKAFNIQV